MAIYDKRTNSANSYKLVTLSDTVDFSIPDGTGQNSSEQAYNYARAFHSNADGYVAILGPGNLDSTTVVVNVVNGVTYPYAVKRFYSTGTCLGLGNLIAMR